MSQESRIFRQIRRELEQEAKSFLTRIPSLVARAISVAVAHPEVPDSAISLAEPSTPDIEKGISLVKNEIGDEEHGV